MKFFNKFIWLASASFLLFVKSAIAADPKVEPAYFTANDKVIITFDATGTPLASQTNVYAWVWIPGKNIDAKYNVNPASTNLTLTNNAKLTKQPLTVDGKQLFTLTFIPSNFFNSNIGNEPTLGILFKGNDWSNGQTTDYLLSFWDGKYEVRYTNPTTKSIFLNNGNQYNVKATAPVNSDFNLFINGVSVYTVSGVSEVNYSLIATTVGGTSKKVKLVGKSGASSDSATFDYIIKTPSPVASKPAGLKLGVNYYTDETKATVTLWAPFKSSVYVLGDFNNWAVSPEYQLNKDGEVFWLDINNLVPGKEYAFQFLVDETLYVADPYNDKVLMPEDAQISSSIYPGLMSFPGQALSPNWYFNRAAVLQTAQTPYTWTATNYVRPAKDKLVVYELLIRDFFEPNARSYKNLTDTISYFKKLGVNAIELMPITQFNGSSSWGYNPAFMFSPARSFGPKNELKRFIDECHKNGIAVILDMVLNHQDLPNPYALMYFDFGASKPAANNPFFNVNATHPFNVFYDMNHESSYTKKYVDTVNHYWLNEYKFDGLRFDLTKGFTQTNNPTNVGTWSAYDASRIAILKRMVDKIWTYAPDTYMIFEHLGENAEEKELAEYRAPEGKGIMMWNKLTDQYNECTMGWAGSKTDISSGYFKNKNWNYPRLMSYMESHDEERLMFKNKTFGNGSAKNLVDGLRRVAAATSLFYSVPGPKMLWQFGELGFDYSINRCEDGSIKEPDCRLSVKPTFWAEFANTYREDLFLITADWIKLRGKYKLFTEGNPTFYGGSTLSKVLVMKNTPYNANPTTASEMNALIAANFDLTSKDVTLTFPHTGTWYDYYNGGTVQVTNQDGTLVKSIGHGNYLFYTDVQIEKDLVITSTNPSILTNEKSIIFPNPAVDGKIEIFGSNLKSVELISTTGKAYVFDLTTSNEINVGNLASGIYVAKIRKSNATEIQKLVIQ